MSESGVVIVGAGAAGATAAGTLRNAGYPGPITVVRGEEGMPYNRTVVNKALLQGMLDVGKVTLPEAGVPGISWTEVGRASGLDTTARTITFATGRSLRYDSLLIATGADPRPFPGTTTPAARERIMTLRTAGDTQRLREWLRASGQRADGRKPTVTILGAGLIGSETAGVLAAAGTEVCLVSLPTLPMCEQLGAIAGSWLIRRHQASVRTVFGQTVTRVDVGEHGALVATLTHGEEIVSDLLLVSIGVTPSTGWLRGTGLDVADGVAVDDQLRAHGAPDVYAAGDLARITGTAGRERRTEHWGNALAQGRHAALTLLYDTGVIDKDPGAYDTLPAHSTRMYGTTLATIGSPHTFAGEELIDGDPDRGRFTVALTDVHQSLVGVVSVGGAKLANALKDAVRRNEPLHSALASVDVRRPC